MVLSKKNHGVGEVSPYPRKGKSQKLYLLYLLYQNFKAAILALFHHGPEVCPLYMTRRSWTNSSHNVVRVATHPWKLLEMLEYTSMQFLYFWIEYCSWKKKGSFPVHHWIFFFKIFTSHLNILELVCQDCDIWIWI